MVPSTPSPLLCSSTPRITSASVSTSGPSRWLCGASLPSQEIHEPVAQKEEPSPHSLGPAIFSGHYAFAPHYVAPLFFTSFVEPLQFLPLDCELPRTGSHLFPLLLCSQHLKAVASSIRVHRVRESAGTLRSD